MGEEYSNSRAIVEATLRYLDEGNRSLRAQLAAINRLRAAVGLPPQRIVEDRRAA